MGAEEQRQQKFDRMTKTPIPRLIGELAVPTIISMLVTSFYNMADTFFVGKSTPAPPPPLASFSR